MLSYSRDFAGEGGEGLGEGQHLGEHSSAQAQHGHGAQGQWRGDDADNRAGKHGQQVPGLGADAGGGGAEPQGHGKANADA